MSTIITRLLLVEDEEDAREILEFYLNTIFDEVEVCTNGKDALDKYKYFYKKDKTFDLVLTDIKMPHLSGLELIKEITKTNEEQKFIIVSAHKDEEYLLQSINLNVISYFVKPLEINNIMDILKKVKEKVLMEKNSLIKDEIIKINKNYTYNTKIDLLYNNNVLVDLSNKETLLMQALIKNIKAIKSKEDLKLFIWNDVNTSDATLRTIIKRVKDKIVNNDFIVSKKGKGYIID